MKQIKRVVSLLLCAILICALTAPAFAGNGFINLESGTFTNNQTFYNRGPFDNYGTLNNNATFDTSGGKINSYGPATQTGVETTSVNKYYTVSFNTDGGGYVSPQTVIAYGTATEPSPAPTQYGCSLEGWYLDKDCANKYDFKKPITGDLTLYAKWTKITLTANWDTDTPGVISWSQVSSANEIKVVMQNTANLSSISQTLSGTATSLDLRKYLCDDRLSGDFTVTVSALDAQGNTIVDASALNANRTIDTDTDTINYTVNVDSTENSLSVKVLAPETNYVGYAWKYIYSTAGDYNPGFSITSSFTVSTAEHNSLASGNSMNVVGIKPSTITENGIWEVTTTADSQKSYNGTDFVVGGSGSLNGTILYVTNSTPQKGSISGEDYYYLSNCYVGGQMVSQLYGNSGVFATEEGSPRTNNDNLYEISYTTVSGQQVVSAITMATLSQISAIDTASSTVTWGGAQYRFDTGSSVYLLNLSNSGAPLSNGTITDLTVGKSAFIVYRAGDNTSEKVIVSIYVWSN